MDLFSSIDIQLFYFVNHLPHTAFLNFCAQMLSGFGNGGIIYILTSCIVFLFEEKKDHWFFLPLSITGISAWIFSEVFLKYHIGRMRPDFFPNAIVIGSAPLSYSFPSTHSTFAFAFAYLLAYKEKRLGAFLYIMAILIGLSRIYLGHHYPSDVMGGALLGTILGWIVMFGYNRIHGQTKRARTPNTSRRHRRS